MTLVRAFSTWTAIALGAAFVPQPGPLKISSTGMLLSTGPPPFETVSAPNWGKKATVGMTRSSIGSTDSRGLQSRPLFTRRLREANHMAVSPVWDAACEERVDRPGAQTERQNDPGPARPRSTASARRSPISVFHRDEA
jgi:hypothetical protein